MTDLQRGLATERMCNCWSLKSGSFRPRGFLSPTPLAADGSHHPSYDAEHAKLASRFHDDCGVILIRRDQLHVTALGAVVLHGGLVVHDRHDHVARAG